MEVVDLVEDEVVDFVVVCAALLHSFAEVQVLCGLYLFVYLLPCNLAVVIIAILFVII